MCVGSTLCVTVTLSSVPIQVSYLWRCLLSSLFLSVVVAGQVCSTPSSWPHDSTAVLLQALSSAAARFICLQENMM